MYGSDNKNKVTRIKHSVSQKKKCMCACVPMCLWKCVSPPPQLGVESKPCVSTVEACSWIEAAVEVPPHGAKEHKEGKRIGKEERKSRGRTEW